MQQTGKIIAAVFILAIVSGCASSRKNRGATEAGVAEMLSYEAELQRVIENNIVPGGFVIQKGSIDLKGTPVEGVFGFNAKVNSTGDIIISVRGPLGIEVIRLLAVGNEICMIERIGRIVYLGKRDEVMKRYGLPEDFIKIFFGDIVNAEPDSISTDEASRIVLEYENDGHRRIVTICPQEGKICKASIISAKPEANLELNFGNFGNNGDIKYPGEIIISDKEGQLNVRIVIEALTTGYNSPIEFVFPSYRRQAL